MAQDGNRRQDFVKTLVMFAAFGWGTALQAGGSRVRFPMMFLEFFMDIFFPVTLCPRGRLSLYHKGAPGIFPGG
jgi:hypothetical protein